MKQLTFVYINLVSHNLAMIIICSTIFCWLCDFLHRESCHLQIKSFTPSSPIRFISFSYLIAFSRTSSIMLNRSCERGHPCLVSDLTGKQFKFSPISMMQVVAFGTHILWSWGSSLLFLVYLIFLSLIGNGFWQMLFLHLLTWSHDFSPLGCWCDGLR